MTNASTTSGRLTAGSPPAGAAGTTWQRMVLLGALLLVLGLVALAWDDGDRLMLAGLGGVAVARGIGMLRGVRAGVLPREAGSSGALSVWFGLAAVAVALLSGTATAWVLVAGLVLAAPALALAGVRRAVSLGAGVLVLAGLVLLAVLGGTTPMLGGGTAVVAVLVAALGLANLLGAVGMWRIARRPAPVPAGGCGGCACGAGGCGSLR